MSEKKSSKLTNDEIFKNRKLRTILWYSIIIFGVATITLSLCSLIIQLSPIYAIICFILETVFTKWRNSIPLK